MLPPQKENIHFRNSATGIAFLFSETVYNGIFMFHTADFKMI